MTNIPEGFCQCGCGQRTRVINQDDIRFGHVKGQYYRTVRNHSKRVPIEIRFWSKVDKRGPDECWLWLGDTSRYGHTTVKGHAKSAHVVAYELTYGPLPKGKYACHTCDNPPCCNPAHIFAGTSTENNHDMLIKGRQSGAKLNADAVREIRLRHANGEQQKSIAAHFHIHQSIISRVVNGKAWHYID